MRTTLHYMSTYWTYGLCAILVVAAGVAFQVGAQGPAAPPLRLNGMPTIKPVPPLSNPRPLETPEQRLTADRGADKEPVSSFLESLKGTDAAFQLIVGQSRLFTTREPVAKDGGTAAIAVSDPTVLDFELLPNPRMIRLIGLRAGVTDLTFTTSDNKSYSFEVHVTYDLELLRGELGETFPDAYIKLGQIREHLVVEGQARSTDQVARITQALEDYLQSIQIAFVQSQQQQRAAGGGMGAGIPAAAEGAPAPPAVGGLDPAQDAGIAANAGFEAAGGALTPAPQAGAATASSGTPVNADGSLGIQGRGNVRVNSPRPQIINLLTVPGIQQVLLQVQIAELNRTALREIGVDWLVRTPNAIIGNQIAGASTGPGGIVPSATTTAFTIFPSGELSFMVRALRRNSVLNVLAEPNLVTMNGQEATFLAGGEFAVPVPQGNGGAGGAAGALTVVFKQFGVQLNFTPYVQDDETIRLKVAPEASTIDYALGTSLFGSRVPGVNTRRLNTTVELRQGQTLALAGLLSVEMDGTTNRIPLLGDLPYIGVMFSNNTHQRIEKELVVLVTPHLVTPMNAGQVPNVPGDDIHAPNDLEFYLLGRIEGRTGRPFRPTTAWDNPLGLVELMKLERSRACGPVGFSEIDE